MRQTLNKDERVLAVRWILTNRGLANFCTGRELSFCIEMDTGVRMGRRTATNLRTAVNKAEELHECAA